MSGELLTIGYDTRVAMDGLFALWTDDLRKSNLLRPEIRNPISVDFGVWPRPEVVNDAPVIPRSEYICLGFSKRPIVNLQDSEVGVCASVYLDDLQKDERDAWRQHTGRPIEVFQSADITELNTSQYKLAGYDVLDLMMISAVSNFGIPDDLTEGERQSWAQWINDYHLFSDRGVAKSFASRCNTLSANLGPFVVFGLWFKE